VRREPYPGHLDYKIVRQKNQVENGLSPDRLESVKEKINNQGILLAVLLPDRAPYRCSIFLHFFEKLLEKHLTNTLIECIIKVQRGKKRKGKEK
jgi:hypothetical protein